MIRLFPAIAFVYLMVAAQSSVATSTIAERVVNHANAASAAMIGKVPK